MGFGSLFIGLTLATSAAGHRSLPGGVTCGNQFNSSATALVIPNPKISWASYRLLTCDAPIFWLSAEVMDVGQKLEFTALAPLIDRFEAVRISVVIMGPGLPTLSASDAVPAEVSAAIKDGEGAVLFESPADQSSCAHLGSGEMVESSSVYGGRCHFHEPYGDSRMWVLLDQAMEAKAAGVHRIAIFTPQKTTAKISFACCDWPEDFTTRFTMPEAECPYCGTKESFAGYSSLFFEKEAMDKYSGFPTLQNCATDPSAPIAPTNDQCPDETPQESGSSLTTQPESCKLGCVGEECHSHNIFGDCTYAMEWITPKPKLYNANVTKMILFKGDTIMFSSASNFWPHNLAKMPSAQHLASCDWTDAVQVLTVEEVRTGTAVSFPEAGTFYYSCQMTGHCELGQKLVVEVKDSAEGMRCHDHGGASIPSGADHDHDHDHGHGEAEQQAPPATQCPSGQVSAYMLDNADYGAKVGECSQVCTSAAGIQWMAGAKEGECADEGFTHMVEEKSVKPAGSPMDVQVMIMSKSPVSDTQCPSGQVSAYMLDNADYGAKVGECSQVCTSAPGIQWMAGAKEGKCADEGFTHMVEEKSVKPAGSPMDVQVTIMGQNQADSCHCHSYEKISCAVSDALYDEHIAEIQEHCASILDGSESVCPYKCFQPFEVLHLHYLECPDRLMHSLYAAVKQTAKCHMAAPAPYGSDCVAADVSMAAPTTDTTDMPALDADNANRMSASVISVGALALAASTAVQ